MLAGRKLTEDTSNVNLKCNLFILFTDLFISMYREKGLYTSIRFAESRGRYLETDVFDCFVFFLLGNKTKFLQLNQYDT